MESCLLVCRKDKPGDRKGKVLFIDAKEELKLERSEAYLLESHIKRISGVYHSFEEQEGFSKIVSTNEILNNKGNLSIQLYIIQANNNEVHELDQLLALTKSNQNELNSNIQNLFEQIKNLGIE